MVALIRLIASAPNGCWELSTDATAAGVPVDRSSSVATTVAGAQVERDAKPAGRGVPGFHADQHVVHDHRGDLVVGGAQHPAERAQHVEVDPRFQVVERREHPLGVGHLVAQGRLGQFQVALLHRGAQDHLPTDADRGGLRPGDKRRHVHPGVG